MFTTRAMLVYSTTSANTVTIDYDQSLRVFLTGGDRVSFSGEQIMRVLNGWAKAQRVQLSAVGRLLVVVGEVRCELTQQAVHVLAHLYRLHDWQWEYPHLSTLFALVEGGTS